VDREIDRRITSHDIRVRDLQQDTLLPDHQHQRLDQYHRGVRIVGGDLTRQLAPDGTVSVFVMLHTGIDLDVGPKLSLDEARDAMAAALSAEPPGVDPELVIPVRRRFSRTSFVARK